MIKVGVIGAGHLGKIHLKIINSSNQNLIGFYDTDETNSKKLSSEYGYKYYNDLDLLLKDIDAAIIVSPTTTHFEISKKCIEAGKHEYLLKNH